MNWIVRKGQEGKEVGKNEEEVHENGKKAVKKMRGRPDRKTDNVIAFISISIWIVWRTDCPFPGNVNVQVLSVCLGRS
jgi:hypothetical protein